MPSDADIDVIPIVELPLGAQLAIKKEWEEYKESQGDEGETRQEYELYATVIRVCTGESLTAEEVGELKYGELLKLLEEATKGMEIDQ